MVWLMVWLRRLSFITDWRSIDFGAGLPGTPAAPLAISASLPLHTGMWFSACSLASAYRNVAVQINCIVVFN